MQNHHIERHEKPAVANSIAKLTRLCKGREERFFIMRNAKSMQALAASSPIGGEANKYAHEIPHSSFGIKKKTPSEEKPRKGNAIAHNQHISGEG